ncbi:MULTISPECIES: hypothetical protein [Pseudomonas]|uniref:hypothetical protein n=1 Tax=Pseudomonas nitroreducens TaxID=46680 RepID=UPI001E33E404|nr:MULTISPECIES: hypothetical protein [Pseudomonas]MCE4070144.1 hypothetical protein [Pseudomonas nitritireducens]MCE4078749.1 hypothetical protein [Pseudomonas nitroreducens]
MWYQAAWAFMKEHVTVTVPGVVAIFAVTFCLVLAMEAGDSGAAWVQAVGSIAAIAAAIWVASDQGRRQLELQRHQEAQALKKVVGVANYVGKINQEAGRLLADPPATGYEMLIIQQGFKRSQMLLNELPYNLIPESEASMGWVELRFAVSGLDELVEQYLMAHQLDEPELQLAARIVGFSDEAVMRIVNACQGHLPELKDPQ